MNHLTEIYRHNLGLLTDLYQLTMAYGYWKNGLAERQAVFHLTFRHAPFGGQYAIACGLSFVVDFLRGLHFSTSDLEYLASLTTVDERPLFEPEFLTYLGRQRFACDVDAVPEGNPVFPYEPLVRVRGPLWQAQVIETALLNIINFQTLIATKASRVLRAATTDGNEDQVIEFGLRRAQGIDGGLSASRAAYIGGCHGTSNLLAGKLFGIPVRGTHAHSWVMAYGSDEEAFRGYATALPENCIFLVDTYNTLDGIRHAAVVGRELAAAGHKLLGVRLDSGDLLHLSREGRRILDEAGLPQASIVASNDLDEYEILSLKRAGAKIDVWGVGTRLVTAYHQPALGGVYKLTALQDERDQWQYRIKLSEEVAKCSDPGILQIRRFCDGGRYVADAIYDEPLGMGGFSDLLRYHDQRPVALPQSATSRDLLVPIFRQGRQIYDPPDASAARATTIAELARLDPQVTQLESPQPYVVALEGRLAKLKQGLIAAAREKSS